MRGVAHDASAGICRLVLLLSLSKGQANLLTRFGEEKLLRGVDGADELNLGDTTF